MTVVAEWVSIELLLAAADDPPDDTVTDYGHTPHWTRHANCLGAHPDYFFGTDDNPRLTIAQIARARHTYCDPCPVRKPCIERALTTHDVDGIWAGTSKRQRDRIHQSIRRGEITLPDVITEIATNPRNRWEQLKP